MVKHQMPWLEKRDRLVLFGDSITAAPDGYSCLLARRLDKFGIKVINAGKGGDKTPTALMRLKSEVIAHKPTAVSIFLGTNDSAIGHGVWADEPRVPPLAYATNLNWIIYLCRLEGIKKFSITPPLRFEGQAYADYGDIMQAYQLAARQVAEDNRAHFVPADIAFFEEWQRHPRHHNAGLFLTCDGVHLTNRGNKLLVESMMRAWGIANDKDKPPRKRNKRGEGG